MTIEKAGIEAVLAKALHAAVTKWCITNVPVKDESRANWVVLGKPTRELRDNIVISIHMQHPLGPNADTDNIVSGKPTTSGERPWDFPKELGGGRMEKYLGCVEINIREREAYEDAVNVISSLYERVKAAINRDPSLVPLEDDWGNTLMVLETWQAYGHESGGGSVSISRRWVDWRAFVYRVDCRE